MKQSGDQCMKGARGFKRFPSGTQPLDNTVITFTDQPGTRVQGHGTPSHVDVGQTLQGKTLLNSQLDILYIYILPEWYTVVLCVYAHVCYVSINYHCMDPVYSICIVYVSCMYTGIILKES